MKSDVTPVDTSAWPWPRPSSSSRGGSSGPGYRREPVPPHSRGRRPGPPWREGRERRQGREGRQGGPRPAGRGHGRRARRVARSHRTTRGRGAWPPHLVSRLRWRRVRPRRLDRRQCDRGRVRHRGVSNDGFVAKLSGVDGSHLWSRRFGGSGTEAGRGVAVDAAGNVVVTGWFRRPRVRRRDGPARRLSEHVRHLRSPLRRGRRQAPLVGRVLRVEP
jgi:hypothetical protein